MTELEGKLRDSVRKLAESLSVATDETMFDPTRTPEERLFSLELAVSSLTREFANMAAITGTIVSKMAEHMGIQE